MNFKNWTSFYRNLGPGLLWAGAAVGVSHLVQSTRAGASYGYLLITVIIIANLLKYPFFEIGPRYASATGKSLLDAYMEMGKSYFVLFILLTLLTMFSITAAVTVVTAGLAENITGLHFGPVLWSAIIMGISIMILGMGSYGFLDRTIKYIIVVLSLSTVIAVVLALKKGPSVSPDFIHPVLWNKAGITFMAALIGWMPSAIDISVWHSLWTLEKQKISGGTRNVKNSLLDFNVGYIGTAVIALAFLLLGALVMYGSGETFDDRGAVFAEQLISLYVKNLGSISYPIIALAAFTTMFSTTITVLDAYPRVIKRGFNIILGDNFAAGHGQNRFYWISIILTAAGALMLLSVFKNSMKNMVDFATILSFLTAPVLAVLNYKAMKLPNIPEEARLPRWHEFLSIAGMVFLSLFALAYLYWRFFMP